MSGGIFELYDFEFERISAEIRKRGAKIVGIQLPSGLKRFASQIANEISNRGGGVEVLISADSCYGACDIDEKLASLADVLFHFGHSEIPLKLKNVVFVELRSKVDVKPAVKNALKFLKGSKICVTTTAQHVHALKDAVEILSSSGKEAVVAGGSTRGSAASGEASGEASGAVGGVSGVCRAKYEGQVLGCDFSAVVEDCDEVLFIGSGGFHPAGIALRSGKRVVAADPFTLRVSVFNAEDLRMRRILTVERAFSAASFGILVCTKIGQLNLRYAMRLREKAEMRGLRSFLLVASEIREETLREFDADAYVNTACPRLVEDFAAFEKPVLTPAEFELILGERSWDEIF
ncbi:MAG: diphthamide synthesis protein [Candidatus Methanospirare jalkutatii]|nr:diphthamide synthesis protein [Candidatus Methanospirare jalkutatii]